MGNKRKQEKGDDSKQGNGEETLERKEKVNTWQKLKEARTVNKHMEK